MSLYFLMLGNFDIIRRDRHFVFLFQFLLFTHFPAQCSWTQAPSFARVFLEVLPITMILFPSELAALGYVHFIPPPARVLLLFWFVPISGYCCSGTEVVPDSVTAWTAACQASLSFTISVSYHSWKLLLPFYSFTYGQFY